MSIRLELIQALSKAPPLLGDKRERVLEYLYSQINDDGGFKNRNGESDLYYSVFGYEAIGALEGQLPRDNYGKYLDRHDDIESLNFFDLVCLARCRRNLDDNELTNESAGQIGDKLLEFRSEDGGFNSESDKRQGTAYGCFLALAAFQDLNIDLPETDGLVQCIESLKTRDGAYANDRLHPVGATPPTAAAITMLKQLDRPIGQDTQQWLLSRFLEMGGFTANEGMSIADLLSTAITLHALALCGADLDPIREPCRHYVESLWSTEGGFRGHWMDQICDCEYTYYGLLALGHLV
ncbi:MAG: hypothetical protein JW860_07395 [Sedimentisphaerales bacterium]|nr:hypothetical protein [Sedimentisphaerales bacterium]